MQAEFSSPLVAFFRFTGLRRLSPEPAFGRLILPISPETISEVDAVPDRHGDAARLFTK